MKRNKDVSRLRSAQIQERSETGTRPTSCAAALERASLVLAHTLEESDGPIGELSGALARMAQTLSDTGAPLFAPADERSTAAARVFRDAFARDIAICIESLQFHDRLTQQLTLARDILTGRSATLAGAANAPANEASITDSIELF
jgi:hypothetical protein